MMKAIGAAGLCLAVLSGCGSGNNNDVTRDRGGLCGIAELRGERISRINGAGSCGISNPVRVTSVGGIRLTGAQANINCQTAEALAVWVERGLKPAVGRRGGGVESMRVAASYSCRTRNNRPGGKLSEHAKGNAIDLSAFTMKDGSTITVLDDWGSGRDGRALRQMHAKACGPFGTVLGPEADRFHQDHFHFDTASNRRPYCR